SSFANRYLHKLSAKVLHLKFGTLVPKLHAIQTCRHGTKLFCATLKYRSHWTLSSQLFVCLLLGHEQMLGVQFSREFNRVYFLSSYTHESQPAMSIETE